MSLPLRIDVVHDRRLCQAMQQNALPFVQLIGLTNTGTADLRDLRCTLTVEPGLCAPWSATVAAILPGSTFHLTQIDPVLRPDVLANATERQAGLLRIVVTAGGQEIARCERALEVLAYNEWPGAASLPALLAAFVLPNHPVFGPLLREASARLERATGRASLEGYQGRDPGRVRAMAQAIFEAVQTRGLTYVNPPASFEQHGQKVRTPEQVFADGMGTCLDLALLLAGALEQAGLHALIVVAEGHAIAGVWPQEASGGEPTVEDPLRLRKRLELGELLLFECTGVCRTQQQTFEQALAAGARQVAVGAKFVFALDLAAARRAHLRPLPLRTAAYDAAAPMPVGVATAATTSPVVPVPAPPPLPAAEKAAEDRLARWQRRLLDLTLRNRLLAATASKKTIPLLVPDVVAWAEALQEGQSFAVHGRPPVADADDPRDRERLQQVAGEDPQAAFLRAQLQRRVLHADLDDDEVDDRMLEIFRHARTSTEESGVSPLYLAVGFLRWFEAPTAKEPRRAPLLLLPVQVERLSVAEGFQIALADEEVRLNQTLLQKLQADFTLTVPGVDELLAAEDGVDVAAVLDAFRRAVLGIDRWEVEPACSLGFFSFTKHLMWLDLQERRAELLQNAFLQHLVLTPGAAWPQQDDWPEPSRLDALAPAAQLCPKDADSSQLCAVAAAADGRSFVLEGPPGTGKSQTITNLIAQCLAAGQRVLFVAEKRAALAVVQKRLQDVGLAPFCLDLHGNKGGKKDVVEHLGRTIDLAREREPAAWAQRAEELQQARAELNAHVHRLHAGRAAGLSLFAATARLCGLREAPRLSGLPTDLDDARVMRCEVAVDALAATAAPLGDIPCHPWLGVGRADWAPALPRELEPLLQTATDRLAAVVAAWNPVRTLLGMSELLPTRAMLPTIGQVAVLLQHVPPTAALTLGAGFPARRDAALALIATGRRRDELWSQVSPRWRRELLALDVPALLVPVRRHHAAFLPIRWWRLRGVKTELLPVTAEGEFPPWSQVFADLQIAVEARTLQQQIDAADADGRQWFGAAWQATPAWLVLTALVERAEQLRAVAAALAPDPVTAAAWLERWLTVADTATSTGPVREQLQTLTNALHAWNEALAALDGVLKLQLDLCVGPPTAPDILGRWQARLAGWRTALPRLRDWCALRRDADAVQAAGLRPVVDALFMGTVTAANVRAAFDRSFWEVFVDQVFAQEPELARFRGLDHERRIARFRSLDQELIELAGKVVRARLCAQLPALQATQAASSELGILLRERKKQRRHLPVRQLFGRIPNLISRLAPCLLMSPLSVAQYLGQRFPPFDLVVFDEASQVPVWDAVGAIGRARSLVVVGDSKQLPPTAFFHRQDGDEALPADDEVEELESVLDECTAAGMHRMYLRWHYRSRHESLIAFSNHHYYDNRLLTFPSPQQQAPGLGVRLQPTGGIYDRGRSQQNRIEAEALVADVVRRLQDPAHSQHSLGIVTFSAAQQVLIEDLLDLARRQHAGIERFFGNGVAEPVFVKNLENVQGDERDVILFSICYGPDQAGKVWMHFGPLNQQGGERRLNVAITRARRELVVFTSLRAEQIELQRTQALGARHLRAFLDYAERGARAIAEAVALDPTRDVESPFERAVAAALRQLGFEVHPQVGCSGYRIDLAIVDPRAPGRYLLGVECDGASYHAAATARDRDRLRAAVLQNLGWRLHRVWSTDWWLDQPAEITRLQDAVQRALQDLPVPPPAPARAPAVAATTVEAAPRPSKAAAPADEMPPYRCARLEAVRNPAAFGERRADDRLRAQVQEVITVEAPVAFGVLCRRVADAWQIPRLTEKVRDRIRTFVPAEVRWQGEVLWRADQDPAGWPGFRVPKAEDALRDVDDLPLVEVGNAMAWLLAQHGSLSAEDLARETAKLFGMTRLSANTRTALERAITALVADGRFVQDGELLRGV
ncbi:MAG: DUF3320 domain-containing protein [Planctomycetes bacterium]|nr:DUF3320 domain-containing protein [Planctomycetota bacterium]